MCLRTKAKKTVLIVLLSILFSIVLSFNAMAGIVINGVDIGYSSGGYWVDTNATYALYGSSQCMAFARYCEQATYGVNDYKNASEFTDITGTKSSSVCTATNLKSWLMDCAPATHLRCPGGTSGMHSISIVYTTEWGVHIAHANWPSDNKIEETDWSWEKLASQVQSRGGLSYARSYNSYSPVNHITDNSYGTNFTSYLKDPNSNHYVFNENHSNTGGYINDVDPVTIHEVYTEGCCK